MVKTRRSSDVLNALDPSKLFVNASDLPNACPVSPSHDSSSSSFSGGDPTTDEDDQEGTTATSFHTTIPFQNNDDEVEEPFFATLISDPLYIHGQILLELAAQKDEEQAIAALHQNRRLVNKKKPSEKYDRPSDLLLVVPTIMAVTNDNGTTASGQPGDDYLPHNDREQHQQLHHHTRTIQKHSVRRPRSTGTVKPPVTNKKQKTNTAAANVLTNPTNNAMTSTTTTSTSSTACNTTPTTTTTTTTAGMKLLSVLHTCAKSKQPLVVRTTPIATVKPPQVLQTLLKKNGMHSLRIRAKQSNYYNYYSTRSLMHTNKSRIINNNNNGDDIITDLRLASFGSILLAAVDASDVTMLTNMFQQGVSPNPCNKFGDDILFTICKRSNSIVFQCFIGAGANVRIVDSMGRTPLHYCAWAEMFNADIVTTLIRIDPQQLFMEDFRGQTPLDHVNDHVAHEWNTFLQQQFARLYPCGLPEIQSLVHQQQPQRLRLPLTDDTSTSATQSSWTPRQLEHIRELVGAERSCRRPTAKP